jgi:tetratricopeptide (TPR) repeat protein
LGLSIAAALIVRDEMRFLPGCFERLAGHVSDIVVVDTGSTDGSAEWARAHGARVSTFAWRQDFAAARNTALDRVRADWVLYIDADERLSVPAGRRLAEEIDPSAIAMRVRFRPKLHYTPFLELRLFRSDPRIRFEGVIHERIAQGIDRVVSEEVSFVGDCAAEIQHLGYEDDQGPKHRRNAPLLEDAIRADPGRVFLYQHRAEVLAAAGDREGAIESCREAMRIAREDGSAKQRADACIACQTLVDLLGASGPSALAAVREGLGLCPGHRALRLLEARILLREGRPQEALAIADQLRSERPDDAWHDLIAYDERVFGEYAHELAAVALHRLGRREEAREAFLAAAAAAPDDPSYRIKAIALGARP